jgi:hypothetical protein
MWGHWESILPSVERRLGLPSGVAQACDVDGAPRRGRGGWRAPPPPPRGRGAAFVTARAAHPVAGALVRPHNPLSLLQPSRRLSPYIPLARDAPPHTPAALWQLCAYEAGLLGVTDGACTAFDRSEVELLEWLDDVRLYETQGPGADINSRRAWPRG